MEASSHVNSHTATTNIHLFFFTLNCNSPSGFKPYLGTLFMQGGL